MTGERDVHSDSGGGKRTPGARRPASAEAGYREDAHAVVIGINAYLDPKIPDLRYARADAEAVYRVLTDPEVGRLKPENVALLLDEDATERKIRSAIGTQLPRRASRDATVCIYYAGHGAPFVNPGVKSADGLEKYLVPHDAEADDLRSTGISMDAVQQWFSWIRANQLVFFLDCCYSGVAGGRTFQHPGFQFRAALTDEFLQHLGDEGHLVVTACDTNEVSLESPKFEHGLFTHYLVEGLKGAADADRTGLVTIDALYDYVYNEVEREARAMGGSMSPRKVGSVRGRVYLTQYETAEQERARELSSEASAAFDRGNLDEAEQRWEEVVGLDPGHEQAKLGLAAIAERRAEERRKHEEEERRRKEALERKARVLLKHHRAGELSVRHFDQAMDLLEKEPQQLTRREKEIRGFLDHLIEGEISPSRYLKSIELVSSERDSGGQVVPAAPPESEATPPQEPRQAEATRKAEEARPRQKQGEAKQRAELEEQRRHAQAAVKRPSAWVPLSRQLPAKPRADEQFDPLSGQRRQTQPEASTKQRAENEEAPREANAQRRTETDRKPLAYYIGYYGVLALAGGLTIIVLGWVILLIVEGLRGP